MKIMKKDKRTVLIVDDSILIMERMIPMMEEIENISFVIHAGSYKEGLEVLSRLTPDMVLLDINLPDRSGIELLRLIRERHLEIAVLMISNNADPYYREICEKLGARQFLDKSKDIDLIPSVLSAAC
jgi:DNA-binding NarL/FixJ family response regulator